MNDNLFDALFPTHTLALDAARLLLKRRKETLKAIETMRAPNYVRAAEGREAVAVDALTEALRQVDSQRDPVIYPPVDMTRWNDNDIAKSTPPSWMNAQQKAILANFDTEVENILDEMADAMVENALYPKGKTDRG